MRMEIGSKAKYLIYETNPENTHNYLEWSYDSWVDTYSDLIWLIFLSILRRQAPMHLATPCAGMSYMTTRK